VGTFQPPTKCVGETEETFLVAFSTDGTFTDFVGVADVNFSVELRYDFSTTGGVMLFDFSTTTGWIGAVVSTLLLTVDGAVVVVDGREFVELFFKFSCVGEIDECRVLSCAEF